MDVKTSDYEPVEKQLAKFMRALAHPARIAIMIRLARQEGCTEGIINDLPIEESSVAKHLKALEIVGLIKGNTSNLRSRYCINWYAFSDFSEQFNLIFKTFVEQAPTQSCKTKV
ncbi:helix-turn-helix transcriptional regulator [Pedobacter sp. Leaf170]|uniref:ArsR/SmtB family transcription factor n=1 Tax=Pedobacter sp. Leaf170 TaxID=2876558 RepID=UPI001E5A78B9|nr:ArsR family transcriptional regulator [Pedobacter sp. Leaf170]